ncbi:lysozyme [Nodularia phage vB_NspS-kac65v162]|jgi:GH24 family phage-related lysozyme (muramidase)|uniref:Endolysin n=3 Tax=Ravarandavirus kac65v151 TaxID=2845689 RepID=A0A482MIB1_9CAUD|nr:endolysin [Nodularia phage vB_NspS-kac65v151]QBQ73107.1 lysozyme [Nodularia phage vB_NspS-kac65v151]QBQ73315.1 lysozyme [Nodularia phage vB_NspS-kac65v161]QBQ73521.1 lysozyme [Nodularia phage vB_NspS-kac65v162]
MQISQNCIDLIKEFEGFRSSAYLCPAGVPTIGYGTTIYPNGAKVATQDTITRQEAEDFLEASVLQFSKAVNSEVNVKLNQNQFDALVSFVYNVGIGAFKSSTMLRLINANKISEAVDEFPKWDKATVNGKKVSLTGLVRRREAERKLFNTSAVTAQPLTAQPESVQESVTWLKEYTEKGKKVVVAYGGSTICEILQFEYSPPEDYLRELLKTYPNANNSHIATPGESVPQGDRVFIMDRSCLDSRSELAQNVVKSAKSFLRLTKTKSKDQFGCYILKLDYFKNGVLVDSLNTCSGIASRQYFRKGVDSVARSLEPLPEGSWRIENIKWAGGRGNWNQVFNSGVGAVSVPLTYISPGSTRRSAIEVHIDNNRKSAPGTAGCVGVYNRADMERFLGWLHDTDPRDFYCDWGLGSCPKIE